ncbi:hypothetical protein BOX15_Mlig026592g1 [Macrostomum lignano]|uniref:BTB domain-containing protein n=2 Tax=Macrostomum lignano TaxID=282301 RepID=A0A1I8G8B9_9PLAT|nr:hypothetical protein BOX15_Mlig026592g1 [Macrostomum lignano]
MANLSRTDQLASARPDLTIKYDADSSEAACTFTSHGENGFKCLHEFYRAKTLCDVKLKIGQKEIACHRLVLACWSPYFCAMFSTPMQESKMESVTLHDLDQEMVAKVIDFFYTGQLSVTPGNVQCLMHTACLLQLEEVVHCCERFIAHKLDVSNAIEARMFAQQHNRTGLIAEIDRFLCQNYQQLVNSEVFHSLSFEMLQSILKSDSLNVPDEVRVFDSVVKWVHADLPVRRALVSNLLHCVRLAQLPSDYLMDSVNSDPLVHSQQACKDLVLDACAFQLNRAKHRPVAQRVSALPHYRPRKTYAGSIFCVGGRGTLSDPYRNAEVYDLLEERWITVEPMHTKRRHVGLVSANGLVYAVGGHDGHEHLSSGEMFDPLANRWSRIASMATRRRGLAVATLSDCLFCLGGLDDIACFYTVERYNPVTDSWANVASMGSPRGGLGGTAFQDKIYVFGGNDSLTSIATCERYDPVKNMWQPAAPMEFKRAGAGAVALDSFIYVLGGFDDNAPLDSVERYDPRADKWTRMQPMTTCRGGVGVAALWGKIYAIGGHDGEAYLDTVECFDPVANRWEPVPGINLKRAGAGVCFADIPMRLLKSPNSVVASAATASAGATFLPR